ncbi:MAG: bifunctional phosphopantothenoylcysteine decarboxylase/phosphopantothenate--cysteine ligase CoaBC [Desulfovibrionaceae bacterium]|nr:bifunctional phosphopantothenoylcysteine decarboxylase/phosphopantothenate--cysteine ligase CoaBC [Desulfovibrionaceae bacterium]
MALSETFFTENTHFAGKVLHLAVTGSVAAYKAADLLRAFLKAGLQVSVTVSKGATTFVQPKLFEALGAFKVYQDNLALEQDCFAHLEPGQKAEVMVVAPASANAIANLAHGTCARLFDAQALAFNGPLVVAPAMNPKMFANPALQANLKTLSERGAFIVKPDDGVCACGVTGPGRLARLEEIFWTALKAMAPQDMAGLDVMVTLGPTREYWDCVRFLSNPSSGRMGLSLALAAWMRGASVHVIEGPDVHFFVPKEIKVTQVQTANEMYEAARELWPSMDVGMFAAAVSDYRPEPYDNAQTKFKKQNAPQGLSLNLKRNPDILLSLASDRRPKQKVLAFAAETTSDMESLVNVAQEKCKQKHADLLVANRVNAKESTFGSQTNQVCVVNSQGCGEIWPVLSKPEVAWRLCSWLLQP